MIANSISPQHAVRPFGAGRMFVFAILTLIPHVALACSCKPMSREQAMAAVNTVFEGRVLRVRKDGNSIYADIEMSRMVKGTVPRIVEVGTPASSPACGYGFKAGERVTVAAQFSQQQYTATLCTMMPLNARR